MSAASLILIVLNFLVSWKGFTNRIFFERYYFHAGRVLNGKEFYRLLTSGFLHTGWMHLIWNMISLYAFAPLLENLFGTFPFLLIYFSSLVGGGLLSLLLHRNDGNYTAVGASGAVSGIIFAAIALVPGMSVGLFFLPAVPGWIYGLIYVLVSILGIRSRSDNIGHDAHLGGAIIGMLVAVVLYPELARGNYPIILLVSLPAIIFIYLIATRPHLLLTNFSERKGKFYSVEDRYNSEKIDRQKEIDRILDKISRHGINSLTPKEKQALEQHSKTFR